MIIVLDTNAFYTFYALIDEKKPDILTPNNKIKRDEFNALISDPNNKIVISTVTIYEFLAKFSKSTQIIKDGLSFAKYHIDGICSDDLFLPFTGAEIDDVLNLFDDHITDKINTYIEKKIEVEAIFSALFLRLLLAKYTELYFRETGYRPSDSFPMLASKCVAEDIKAVKEKFVVALHDAYHAENIAIEKVIKDLFNSMLYEILVPWMSFLEILQSNPRVDMTEEELYSAFIKLVAENPYIRKIDKRKDNINQRLAKLGENSNPQDIQLFRSIYRKALEGKGIEGIQIDYMDWIMSKMGQRGAKFTKNDILDMLIATVLKDSGAVLISFDEDMQDFIASIGHISKSYIEKVYER